MGVSNLIKLTLLSYFVIITLGYSQEMSETELMKKLNYYNSNLNKDIFSDSLKKEIHYLHKIAKKNNYINALAITTPFLAQQEFNKGAFDNAISYAKDYLKISRESNNNYNTANAYSLLFKISHSKNNYPDAIKKALIAETYLDKVNTDTINGGILLYLNFHYLLTEISDYKRAHEKIERASELYKNYKGRDSLHLKALILEAQGLEQLNNNNLEAAQLHFEKALTAFENHGFKPGIASSYNNIGVVYFELGDYNESLTNLKKSYDILLTCDNQFNMAETSYYLGKNYSYLKQLDKAKQYFDTAITSGKLYNNAIFFCKANFEKLKLLFSEKDELGAEKLLNNIIENELFLDYQDKDEFFLLLLNYYTRNDNKYKEIVRQYQEAFRAFKKKLQEKNLNKLEYVYDYQKTKDSLELNKAEINNVIAEGKKKEERIYWLVVLLTIIAITVIIIFYNKARVYKLKNQKNLIKAKLFEERKNHNEKLIDYRNRKLVDFAIHVNEKNKILNKIKDQLKVLSSEENKRKSEVYNLISFITNTINQSKDQVQIFKDADKLNEQFLANLSTKYPELNKQERRVVTFIRLGLNSKQIATQMNISYNTVENYRYKIRKKMNLSRETSLKKFVNTI